MIRNKEYHAHFVDFTGLQFDKISPKDFDAFLEFGNKLFIFIETKYKTDVMPIGQELAIQRLCDACQTENRTSIAFLTRHDVAVGEGNIILADSIVVKYRYKGEWQIPKEETKLSTAVTRMVERYGK